MGAPEPPRVTTVLARAALVSCSSPSEGQVIRRIGTDDAEPPVRPGRAMQTQVLASVAQREVEHYRDRWTPLVGPFRARFCARSIPARPSSPRRSTSNERRCRL